MSVHTEHRYQVGSVVLSAIEAGPEAGPGGVVVALHGSGYTGRYWDGPGDEASSLLKLGGALGFRVVAVDRPGYGASATIRTEQKSLESQADLLGRLIADLHARWAPAPVFVIGHSLGSLLAVRLAAREAASYIAALDVAGLPIEWRDDVRRAVHENLDGMPSALSRSETRLAMYFGPAGTYDPALLRIEREFSQRIPGIEMSDSLDSPEMLRRLAPDVRVPVQCTVAEFEGSIAGGPEAVDANRRLFANSPRAVAHWQPGAGHNVSLHRVGRAYHLRALAFFDEVAASMMPLPAPAPVEELATLVPAEPVSADPSPVLGAVL
jgi:pimeloyl-ACP methyl ester carboxylesterase